jgi:ABC-type amino acid transport substrate-binding protein
MNDSRFKKLIQVLLVLLSLTQLNSQNLTLTTPNCYDNGTVTYSMYANITNYLQHNNNIDKRDIINKPADLKNKTVGVLPGMPINLGNYGKVTTFPNTEDLIKALKNHTIDGIIVDENTNDYIVLHNYDLSEIPEKIDTVEYGPIFNKKFTDPFNEFASKTNIQNLMEEWSGINYDAQTVDKNLNGNNGTIRAVAYLGNRPYAYKDEKGEPTGSCLDLIYSFAKSAGYKVEFKEVSTYDDQIDAIKNGNADMSCAYITDSLKNDVGTINNNTKQDVSSIIRLSNSEKSNENENKQYYETYKDLDGKKLGVLSDSVFDNVTKTHFSNSELVYYKDTFHLFKSLFTDEIEGFLTDVPNAEDFQKRFPEKVSYFGENFYNNSYGFAFKNNKNQIFKDFQSYLSATGNKLIDYYEKWRNDDNPPTIDKRLNKSAPTIRVAMFPDTKPICFEKNKEITGYEIQLLYEFAKEKNYNIELITLENSGERISYITEDKADIAGGALTITPEREKLVSFSFPILLAGTNLVVSREKRKLPGKIQVLDENYTPKENNTISFPVKVGDKDTVSVCVFPENFEYNELSLINCTIPDLKGVDPTKNGLTLGTSNDTLGLNNVEYNPTNLLNGNTLLPGYPIINESDKTNYICYAEPLPTTVPPTTTPTTVTTTTPPLNNSTLTYYKSSKKRLSTGTIIGIIIPLAVALVGATIGAFLCRRGPPFPAPVYSQRLDTSSYKFNVVSYYPKQIQVNQLPVQQVIPGQQIVPVQQVVTQQVVTDPTAVIVNNP